MTAIEFSNHADYDLMYPTVKLVRDCIEGEPRIKYECEKKYTYLKHPNMLDTNSLAERRRYSAYLQGAEFDGFPSETEGAMLGKMTEGEMVFDLPDRIEYLVDNADGDGLSLDGLTEILYKNLLEVKFHVLLAEYSSLASLDIDQVSIADLKELKPRASIKSYTRESLVNWAFRRINGVMQLSLMVLLEESMNTNPVDMVATTTKSKLVLALDGNGEYFQQKYSETDSGGMVQDGDPHYPTIAGGRLKWIPAQIVIDEKTPAGKLPRAPGYLYPICSASLARFGVSADYKEALHFFGPTLFNSGWKDGDFDMFKAMNGRDYIAFGIGVANNLPEGVVAEIVGSGVQLEPFERYFEINERKQRALGAKINDGTVSPDKTATEASIDNSNNTAVFQKIVNNVESALVQIISYCAMYEGLCSPEEVEAYQKNIVVTLPREFGAAKLSAEEQMAIRDNMAAGLISKDEAIRQLVAGGRTLVDAETLIKEIESQGPLPIEGAKPVVQE